MGVSEYSMFDISWRLKETMGVSNALKAENSTSRKGNTELNMEDFLQLMIVQLQSQTLDDTMDTSEMMNQMVQMQMVTALTNMTETNIMTYASSLVGKEVTIGILTGDTVDGVPVLEERVVKVTGTGMSNGQYVIFGLDEATGKTETYTLDQIMAIGTLPPLPEEEGDPANPPADPAQPTQPADPAQPDDSAQIPGDSTDKPVDNVTGTGEDAENTGDSGTDDGTVAPTEPVE